MTPRVALFPRKAVAGFARGTYTEIVAVDAPSSAVAGETVPVTIKIKNLWTDYVHIYAIGVADTEDRFIDWLDHWVPAGATQSFSGSFTMPNRDVTIQAYSFYEAEGVLYFDDEAAKDVSLEEVVGWQLLDTRLADVGRVLPGWQLLDSKIITVESRPPPVVGWQLLDEKTVGLAAGPPEEIPPEYVLIQDTIHPAAYVWEGEAEVCTIEFPLTPDQLPFTQWGGLKIAEAFANAVEAEGNSLLEVKVFEDITPVFWTNYRVEIKAAVASEEQGVAFWPWVVAIGAVLVKLPWAFIIKGTLVLIGIWLAGWIIEKLIKGVDRVIHVPPTLTEEEKQELSREDLIKLILYEAPKVEYEVSPEDLDEMSDDGLRALLNELIAEAAPPEIAWGPLAIVGGLGVLGIGVAVALAAPRRKGHHSSIVPVVAAATTLTLEEERRKETERRKKEKPKGLRW